MCLKVIDFRMYEKNVLSRARVQPWALKIYHQIILHNCLHNMKKYIHVRKSSTPVTIVRTASWIENEKYISTF